IDFGGGEDLADLVVKFAGQVAALDLLDVDQTPGEGLKSAAGPSEFGLRLSSGRNLLNEVLIGSVELRGAIEDSLFQVVVKLLNLAVGALQLTGPLHHHFFDSAGMSRDDEQERAQ